MKLLILILPVLAMHQSGTWLVQGLPCFLGNQPCTRAVHGQKPIITDCRRAGSLSMGELLEKFRIGEERRKDANFYWWIHRYEKGWNEYPPPWYIKERVDEYLKGK